RQRPAAAEDRDRHPEERAEAPAGDLAAGPRERVAEAADPAGAELEVDVDERQVGGVGEGGDAEEDDAGGREGATQRGHGRLIFTARPGRRKRGRTRSTSAHRLRERGGPPPSRLTAPARP